MCDNKNKQDLKLLNEKAMKYINDELPVNEITKEIITHAYLNYYEKEFLYNYPYFFYQKLKKSHLLTSEDDIILKQFLDDNPVINDDVMRTFFNLDCITIEMVSYVGW